jgi:hypothetical protein
MIGLTVRRKVSAAPAPAESETATRISTVDASLAPGVPLKARVAALKLNQPGSGLPSARVAA